MNKFEIPGAIEGVFDGEEFSKGTLPAFFYFSFSGEESLTLPPYNSPVTHVSSKSLRIFSFTIPGHEEGQNRFHAMKDWAENLEILKEFIEKVAQALTWLIENEIVDPAHIAVGGLSRGGFIATHVAAREKRVSTLLAF